MFNFEVKSSTSGMGLFTKQPFKKGQVILRFEGKIINENTIDTLSKVDADNCLQFDLDKYLVIDNHNSFFVNHSCVPNCLIKSAANNIFLLALNDIKQGEELFFDYSTTSTDNYNTYNMKCNCGKYQCRKVISGFDSIPFKTQLEYIVDGAIPQYIIEYFGVK